MKFLFLDVDGVLNDHRRWSSRYSPILYDRVEILNTIFEEVPDLHIVLSSAWRYTFDNANSVQHLLMCHGFDHYGHVHGVTCKDEEIHTGKMPACDDIEGWKNHGLIWRVMQIQKYLEQYPVNQYVVLDDLSLNIPNLVQTDPTVGLTQSDAQKAIEILKCYS